MQSRAVFCNSLKTLGNSCEQKLKRPGLVGWLAALR